MIYRQGDLAFIFVSPPASVIAAAEPVVIARGESSGHWHTLVGGVLHRVPPQVPSAIEARNRVAGLPPGSRIEVQS